MNMVSQLVKTFTNLVGIDSESGNETKFARYLTKTLRNYANRIEEDRYGNLYIYSWDFSPRNAIMLNTHMDTVTPGVGIKPKIKNGYIVSSGDTILGADSKAGISAFVELVRYAKSHTIRPFVVTLTRNEESGIPTAQYLKAITKFGIVPDRGSPTGEYSTKAPYAQVFEIVVKGKFAYAPTNYNDGRSALLSLVSLVNAIKLGNIDKDTTVNLGTLNSGNTASMIPDMAYLKGSIYSFENLQISKYLDLLARLLFINDKKHGTISRIKKLEYYPGFYLSQRSDVVRKTRNAISTTGLKPIEINYKAVTNANFLNALGIETILLSTGVKNQHTVREKISIKDLHYTYDVILRLLTD